MSRSFPLRFLEVCALFWCAARPVQAATDQVRRFDFGAGEAKSGEMLVTPGSVYSTDRGYGVVEASAAPWQGAASGKPFRFRIDLPEGNYRVTVVLGRALSPSDTTVKAEARRLMLEKVILGAGKFESRVFAVNVRSPRISTTEDVSLNRRELGPPMALDWDGALTLEFDGSAPGVRSLEVARVENLTTVFLAGDSTVTDQPGEPWAAWGQMLPRFFKPDVVVANYAESGLALTTFRAQKRFEKILSVLRPGDYVFIQFGHNDQKDKAPGAGPFTTYRTHLEEYVAEVRKKGGLPVLITPMERRRWDQEGRPQLTLTDYAEAVRQVGKKAHVPVIDLHAMSRKFYAALGPENSKKAFVHYPAGAFPGQKAELEDDTHHSAYGAYELAKCVVEGIRTLDLGLKKSLVDHLPSFDPSKPDAFEQFDLPRSPLSVSEKPAGN